jgi:hypothetical protein
MAEGFFVNSDYVKDKNITHVLLNDWIKFIDIVIHDDICCARYVRDKKGDIKTVIKERSKPV